MLKTDTFTGTVFWSLPRLCLAVMRGGVLKTDTFTGFVFWSLPLLCLAAVGVDVFCVFGGQ